MTRYKKYAKNKLNIKLENEYEYLPFDFGSVCLEGVGVWINDNKIIVKHFYTSITDVKMIDKYGNVTYDWE